MGFVFLIHRSSGKSISCTYGHVGGDWGYKIQFIIFPIFGIIEISNIRGNIIMDVKKKKPIFKRWWFIILMVIFLISLLGSLGKDDVEPTINEAASTDTKLEEPQAEPVEEATEVVEDVPREYKAALKKAELYASTMYMSKAGVFKQLTSEYGEKFPEDAAQYAIDNMKADWKANALKKAETYAETMSMSNSGIYDQLTSEHGEQFTAEEAQYAIDNLN